MLLPTLVYFCSCLYAAAGSGYFCDFSRNEICDWIQDKTDQFDWTMNCGCTLSAGTGPTEDHTNGSGYYMYIETSYPMKHGDTARLIGPKMTGNGQPMCFTFWYHMFGQHIGSLNIYVKKNNNIGDTLWTRSGSQDNAWKLAKVAFSATEAFTIVIEGVRGYGYQGDIAIDDTNIVYGACSDCHGLRPPAEGYLSTTSVISGTYLNIMCNPGYTLFGDQLLICQKNGTWSASVGVCTKDCPVLVPYPNNIISILSTNETKSGTRVHVSCFSGYTVIGDSYLVCQKNGSWSGPLGACEKDCPTLTEPVMGYLSTRSVTSGTHVYVSCSPGYTLLGDRHLVCQSNGVWSGNVADCAKNCPVLPPLPNGHLPDTNGSNVGGIILLLTCNPGYTLFGFKYLQCMPDGQWSAPVGECRKDCPSITPPADGCLSTSDIISGTYVYVFCRTGYLLIGDRHLTCQSNGSWSASVGKCRKLCPTPMPPDNGYTSSDSFVTPGVNLYQHCNPGYSLFGFPVIKCLENGLYSAPFGECRKDCPTLTPPLEGSLSTTVVTSGTYVYVSCNQGYTLFGDRYLICDRNGSWSSSLWYCNKDCPELLPPQNGTLSTTKTTQGTSVNISCFDGFTLVGKETVYCHTDGSWSSPLGYCRRAYTKPTPDQQLSYTRSKATVSFKTFRETTTSVQDVSVSSSVWMKLNPITRTTKKPASEAKVPTAQNTITVKVHTFYLGYILVPVLFAAAIVIISAFVVFKIRKRIVKSSSDCKHHQQQQRQWANAAYVADDPKTNAENMVSTA